MAHAIKHRKNIVPIFLSNVSTFPEGLPEDIAANATTISTSVTATAILTTIATSKNLALWIT